MPLDPVGYKHRCVPRDRSTKGIFLWPLGDNSAVPRGGEKSVGYLVPSQVLGSYHATEELCGHESQRIRTPY